MTRPVLKAVPINEKTIRLHCAEVNRIKRMVSLRKQLLLVAVDYIVKEQNGGNTRNDRLRFASELSGIPLNLLKVEVSK